MSMSTKDIGFMTVTELSRLLGVSRQRTHKLIEQYGVRPVKLDNGTFLISPKEADKIPLHRPPCLHLGDRS